MAAKKVTPLAGVWIERFQADVYDNAKESLPLRECGLKACKLSLPGKSVKVTPLAGVWIESGKGWFYV